MVLLMNKNYSFDELGALAFVAQIHSMEEQLTSLQRYYESKTYQEREHLGSSHNSFFWKTIFHHWDLESRVFEPDYFPSEIDSLTGELDAISFEHFKFEIRKMADYAWGDLDSLYWSFEIDDFLRVFFR